MKTEITEFEKLLEEELQKEGLGDFVRSISGKDEMWFKTLNDLWSPTSAIGKEAFLLKNRDLFLNKANYGPEGPLYTAALYAVEAENKNNKAKGYGKNKSINDLFNAVVDAYRLIGK